ncbi:ADQ_G0032770.mRNA.1.CDS.1 [Saccharomyces cerevisiae]|nr:ADQ_G0032770.mRNA.1.CDS.1 [Saccharomyces cerevisiae]CAI4588659.1 CLN_G0033170.mRNA.1.CDS.1 [Saccharomyces cerevisiae]CAI5291307.1 CMF_HP2_G0030060.mRNA.1.CDS.1 [Saccharomyces cerevisiae]CAI6593917.1 CMF_HP2_G0030060.mRNA.1.CDS.1 [Saccharomyces cerevisiae]CAI6620629.1 CMF_HP1_G0033000.mRNA.1.CDS.1 [Saccharomyces cerevisiae]
MYHVPEMRLHYPLVNTQSNAAITPTRSYDNTFPSFNELSHQSTINLPFVQRETPNAYANVAQLATSPT